MRKLVLVAFCLLLAGSVAMAQVMETKWHCSKSGENPTLEVGDMPGHTYGLAHGTCDATSSKGGEKSGAWTEFEETWKASYTLHGRFNVTMDNGDMVYYTYERMGKPSEKKLINRWKIVSGTGKHRGIRGSGSCTGTWNDDGTADFQCTGTNSMGGAAKKS
jgi:hypothetical protein